MAEGAINTNSIDKDLKVCSPKDMLMEQNKQRPTMIVSIAEKIEDAEEYRQDLQKAYLNGASIIALSRSFDGWMSIDLAAETGAQCCLSNAILC